MFLSVVFCDSESESCRMDGDILVLIPIVEREFREADAIADSR